MGMLKSEMKKGVKCHVRGHAIHGDTKSPMIDSKGVILESPVLSTVLVELDNPPKGISNKYNVPIECIYWTSQK